MKTIEIMTASLQKRDSIGLKLYSLVGDITLWIKHLCYFAGIIIWIIVPYQTTKAVVDDTKYYFEMIGKVKQNFRNHNPVENSVDSALITISDETKQVTKTYYSDRFGKCQFKLPMNKLFEIRVSKKGYVTKIMNVDTRIPTKKLSVYTLIFDIYLFEDIKGLDVSLLKTPIAKIIFNNDSDNFVFDRLYTYNVNEKIKKIYLDYYNLHANSQKTIPAETTHEYIERPHENVVFQVQLIAVNKRLPLNSTMFSECGSVNECYSGGLYKYTAGEFRSLSPAQELLSRVLFLGFSDAFIVAVKGEERIPVGAAVHLLSR